MKSHVRRVKNRNESISPFKREIRKFNNANTKMRNCERKRSS